MATIREMIIAFKVDADANDLNKLNDGVNRLARGAAVAAAALVAAAGAIVAIAVATAKVGDDAAKNAQRMGVTVEEYQQLAHAADIAGMSIDTLRTGFRGLSRVIDTADTSSEAAEALERVGLNARDAEGNIRPLTGMVSEIADVFADMEDGAEKTALAQALFSRSGTEMIPFLNQGADGIEAVMNQALALGIVMSEDATKASESFNDRIVEMKGVMMGLRNAIGVAVIPTLTSAMESFVSMAVQMRALFVSLQEGGDRVEGSLSPLIIKVVDLASSMVTVVKAASKFIKEMWRLRVIQDSLKIGAIVAAMFALKVVLFTYVIPALALTNLKMLILRASAIATQAAFIAGAIALTLFLNDLWAFMNGHDSVIGRLISRNMDLSDGVNSIGEGILALFGFLKNEGDTAFQHMFNGIEWFVEASAARFNQFRDMMQNIVQQIIIGARMAANELNIAQRPQNRRATRAQLQDELQAAQTGFSAINATGREQVSDAAESRRYRGDLIRNENAERYGGGQTVTTQPITIQQPQITIDARGMSPEELERSVTANLENFWGGTLRTAARAFEEGNGITAGES